MDQITSLSVTLDRLEGELAVLRFEDGQELAVPRKLLPPDSHEGSILICRFASSEQAEQEQADQARKLLTQILKGS